MMEDSQLLAGVSAAQLAVGLGGMALAIRRRPSIFRSGRVRNPQWAVIRCSWELLCPPLR